MQIDILRFGMSIIYIKGGLVRNFQIMMFLYSIPEDCFTLTEQTVQTLMKSLHLGIFSIQRVKVTNLTLFSK